MADVLQLGRYMALAELASGGMATVYLGRMSGAGGFGRTVAIKRLHPHLAHEPDFVSMFLDEARLVARVQHPNVVPTLDVVTADGEIFLVLEYIKGEPLGGLLRASRAKDQSIPVPVTMAIAIGLLSGLHAAHEAKDERGVPLDIVHRDVSPQNVIVGCDGVARVLDFGVAKAASRLHTTREGQLKGKMAYMAPEHVAGHTSRQSDIYSAAIVVWEMLALQRLFTADNDAQLLNTVLHPEVPPPSSENADVPAEVDRVVMKALAVRPEDRYATAREMAEALDACMRPASANQVAEWLESVAGSSLTARNKLVADIESRSARPDLPEWRKLIELGPAALLTPESAPSLPRGENAAATPTAKEPTSPGTASLLTPSPASLGTKPGKAGRWWTLAAILGVVAGGAVGLSMVRGLGSAAAPPAPPPSGTPSASAAPHLVRLIDLPPPASKSPEALAAYAEGLRDQHDGVNAAYRRFERALVLDPGFAAAHLRLMELDTLGSKAMPDARAHYRAVLAARATLSVRDRQIADALEPAVMSDPPDWKECSVRLRKLHEDDRFDQGIAELLVWLLTDPEAGSAALEEARALSEAANTADPSFGEPWSDRVQLALMDNRMSEVASLAQECLRAAPRATECLAHTIAASSSAGDCPAVANGGRRWTSISPDDRWGGYYLAVALMALGEPAEAVDEAVAGELLLEHTENRAASEARWAAARSVRRGDFLAADQAAEKLAAAEGGSSFTYRADGTVLRVGLARERGDLKAAATFAQSYVNRRTALSSPDLDVDPLPLMLAAERAGGLLTSGQLETRMEAWRHESHAQFGSQLPPMAWIVGDARVVTSHDDALAAIASRPPLPTLPLETGFGHVDRATYPALIGRVSLLAGRFEEAVPLLEEAARTCFVRDDPMTPIQASQDLGEARERLGDKAAACEAYGKVLALWGHAKPRSVTADKARERAKALGCPPAP